ncbi:hypothetical protein PO909_025037 [Leuciscus waleckii]
MGISHTHQNPTDRLLTCFQNGCSIGEYVKEFLDISNQLTWTDDVLKNVFGLGLDDPLHQPASAAKPCSFAQYLDHVLLLNGKAFTCIITQPLNHHHQPSTSPHRLNVFTSGLPSLSLFTPCLPSQRLFTSCLPCLCPLAKMAVASPPEPLAKIAATSPPESSDMMAADATPP